MTITYHVTILHDTLALLDECLEKGTDFVPGAQRTQNEFYEPILVIPSQLYWELVEESQGMSIDWTLNTLCRTFLGKE